MNPASGLVEKVSPAHTSQRCPACGHAASQDRKSQAVFARIAICKCFDFADELSMNTWWASEGGADRLLLHRHW